MRCRCRFGIGVSYSGGNYYFSVTPRKTGELAVRVLYVSEHGLVVIAPSATVEAGGDWTCDAGTTTNVKGQCESIGAVQAGAIDDSKWQLRCEAKVAVAGQGQTTLTLNAFDANENMAGAEAVKDQLAQRDKIQLYVTYYR